MKEVRERRAADDLIEESTLGTISRKRGPVPRKLQNRTLKALSASQIVAGIGVAGAGPAGALLVMEVSGNEALSGLAQTFSVLGAALMAVPLAGLTNRGGRRLALISGYLIGSLGAFLAVVGGSLEFIPILLAGTLLVGAATASNYQIRFAAIDLSSDEHRSRDLSLIVWAGTVGAVLGPNLLEISGRIGHAVGLPELTGPYLVASAALLVGAAILWVFLRPDPYLYAKSQSASEAPRRKTLKESLPLLKSSRSSLLAISAIVIGHIAMVSIMVMTPVHMRHVEESLNIIGLVISVHIVGMFAFSPIMGMLSDRLGRVTVIMIGALLLLCAGAISASSPAENAQVLGLGLFLLGLGWSATLVAGSTLLVESLPVEDRASIQGVSDLLMNAAGAVGGAVSGIIIATSSYAMLCFAACLPVMWLAVNAVRSFKAGADPKATNQSAQV